MGETHTSLSHIPNTSLSHLTSVPHPSVSLSQFTSPYPPTSLPQFPSVPHPSSASLSHLTPHPANPSLSQFTSLQHSPPPHIVTLPLSVLQKSHNQYNNQYNNQYPPTFTRLVSLPRYRNQQLSGTVFYFWILLVSFFFSNVEILMS